jgi:RNA polymerase sigma-70 factor (ECF subfamily)
MVHLIELGSPYSRFALVISSQYHVDHANKCIFAAKGYKLSNWQQALDGIRAGNSDSFDAFISLAQNTVYSFGRKVCGHVEDAEDTMQQTLLKAFEELPELQFTSEKALRVWLYKVAKNVCLTMRRKGKFEPVEQLSLEQLMPDRANIIDWTALPDDLLANQQTSERIHQAIQKLAPDYKLVIVLRDMEDLSTPEVAEILGITEQNVKIRLHRARLFLRRELEQSLFHG